jgi:putative endonuclease
MTERHLLGVAAERAAASWLEAQGWQVLARNWCCPGGELDIVCRQHDVIAFVEVRSQGARSAIVRPEHTVGASKRAKLTQAALRWLSQHPQPRTVWRFDIIAAYQAPNGDLSLQHFPNAFTPKG